MKRILILLCVLWASEVSAATITVCASGCTYNLSQFQSALNAANLGDTITIAAGATVSGNFTLPDKGAGTSYITIKSDAMAGDLPGAGVRTSPDYLAFLPLIKSGNTTSAITTTGAAHHWKFENVAFGNNNYGYGDIVAIGNGDTSQVLASQEPHHFIFDRVYMYGDPVAGQKRGINLNGRDITVSNSYIHRIAGLGQDSQCLASSNSTGGYTITNNFLECAGYNFIIGGADPFIRTYLTVTGSATTTGAAVAIVESGHTLAELANGQLVAIETSAGVQFANLTAQPGSGTTGTLAWTPAISVAPAVGGRIRGGLVTDTVTITGNHFTKNLAWRDGAMAKPTNLAATPSAASGSLPAGTYYYRVQAFNPDGYGQNWTFSFPTAAVSATLGATGKVDLTWTASPYATVTRLWRCPSLGATTGCQWLDATTNSSSTDDGTGTWFDSDLFDGTSWVVKNLFELKQAKNVTVSGNIFENGWRGSDNGSAWWIKSSNQDGDCWWCQTSNVTLENNIVRHVAGWLSINGREMIGGNPYPPPVTNVTVRNNLIYDSNEAWGDGQTQWGIKLLRGGTNISILHNTLIHTMQGLMTLGSDGEEDDKIGLVIQDNMFYQAFYGIHSSVGLGTAAFTAQAPGAVVTYNVFAQGDNPNTLPALNFTPTFAAWQAEFVAYSADGVGADYHLKPTSTYIAASTTSGPIGADIDAILTATADVIQGTVADPPEILTQSLPAALEDLTYASQTLVATGGTAPLVWTVTAGSLPTGLSLSSGGALTGTPTTPGSYNFTVTVTDDNSLTDSQAYTIPIYAVTLVTTTTLPAAEAGLAYSQTLVATGDLAPYTWAVTVGSLPSGLSLAASTGVLSGVPTAGSTFTVRATGSLGSQDTQALTLTVTTETLPAGRARAYNGTEARVFRRRTAPTDVDKVARGDLWLDTSVNPPTLSVATTTTPTWTALESAGGTVGSLDAANLTGTLPSGVFPPTIQPGSLLAAPVVQVDQYAKFTVRPCTELSTAGTARLCVDSAGVPKWSINGGDYAGLPVLSTGKTASLALFGPSAGTAPTGLLQWTNITDGHEFVDNLSRFRLPVNLSGYTQARVAIRLGTAGPSGATLCIQYTADPTGNSGWTGLNGVTASSGGICTKMDSGSRNYAQGVAGTDGSWGTIAAPALGDVVLRLIGYGGDGSTDPTFGNVQIQVR